MLPVVLITVIAVCFLLHKKYGERMDTYRLQQSKKVIRKYCNEQKAIYHQNSWDEVSTWLEYVKKKDESELNAMLAKYYLRGDTVSGDASEALTETEQETKERYESLIRCAITMRSESILTESQFEKMTLPWLEELSRLPHRGRSSV